MITFNVKALEELKKCKENIDQEVPKKILNNVWLSTSPKEWFSSFNTRWTISNLSDIPLNRIQLLELIHPYRNIGKIDESTLRKLIVSVFAWGGLGRSPSNGKLAIDTIEAYQNVCSKLLNGMSSIKAYAKFFNLKMSKKMQGIRPAYYTKLIFFLGDQSGLIMDQWTARSTNLLLNSREIKLESRLVSDDNSEEVYNKYLAFIAELKNELNIKTLAQTEELIFSCPHKNNSVKKRLGEYFHKICSAWRKYVAENT